MSVPVFYSFRRCPYCMRAHMALKYAGIKTELREVDLNALPEELSQVSDSGTVPVLVLPDGEVIDESWEIVKWALSQNDPDNWLGKENEFLLDAEILVETNDFSFKEDLDHYKYADRSPENSEDYYRQRCEEFIAELEGMLEENQHLLADQQSLADIGIFPFVRQFSLVDNNWFSKSPYKKVKKWLKHIKNSDLFEEVFQKHENWKTGDPVKYI